MFKTILLTVDIENPASWTKALPAALKLATDWQATLHVLTVIPTFGSADVAARFPADYETTVLKRGYEKLLKVVADAAPEPEKVVTHLRHGVVHEAVLSTMKKIGADLLVMSSHAPDPVREFFVGSQADRVVRRSPVSVLVIRG